MKRFYSMMTVMLAVAMIAAVTPASAGFYGGGSVGQGSADASLSDFDDGSLSGSFDDSDTSFRVYGGMTLFKFFGIEAAFEDLGEISADATSDGSGLIYGAGTFTGSQSADGFSLSAIGRVPVGANFAVFARVGYLMWDAEMSMTNAALPGGTLTASTDGEDLQYGAGLTYNYPGPGKLRFELEQSKVADLDVNTASLGVAFRF